MNTRQLIAAVRANLAALEVLRYGRKPAPGQQEFKWITVHPNGPEHEGRPIAIKPDGEIAAGPSSLIGKKLGDLKNDNKTPPATPAAKDHDIKAGDHFKTHDGSEFRAHAVRHGQVVAHSVVDGKPKVNRDSGVMFAHTEQGRIRNPEHRTDIAQVMPQAPLEPLSAPEAKPEAKPTSTLQQQGEAARARLKEINSTLDTLAEQREPLWKKQMELEQVGRQLRDRLYQGVDDEEERKQIYRKQLGNQRSLDNLRAKMKPLEKQGESLKSEAEQVIATIRSAEKEASEAPKKPIESPATAPSQPTGENAKPIEQSTLRDAAQRKPEAPSWLQMPDKSVKNEEAKAGDQLGLFGEGQKASTPWNQKPIERQDKKRQTALFNGLNDDPDQKNFLDQEDERAQEAPKSDPNPSEQSKPTFNDHYQRHKADGKDESTAAAHALADHLDDPSLDAATIAKHLGVAINHQLGGAKTVTDEHLRAAVKAQAEADLRNDSSRSAGWWMDREPSGNSTQSIKDEQKAYEKRYRDLEGASHALATVGKVAKGVGEHEIGEKLLKEAENKRKAVANSRSKFDRKLGEVSQKEEAEKKAKREAYAFNPSLPVVKKATPAQLSKRLVDASDSRYNMSDLLHNHGIATDGAAIVRIPDEHLEKIKKATPNNPTETRMPIGQVNRILDESEKSPGNPAKIIGYRDGSKIKEHNLQKAIARRDTRPKADDVPSTYLISDGESTSQLNSKYVDSVNQLHPNAEWHLHDQKNQAVAKVNGKVVAVISDMRPDYDSEEDLHAFTRQHYSVKRASAILDQYSTDLEEIHRYGRKPGKGQQEFQWVTMHPNGKEHEGVRVAIADGGKIVAGPSALEGKTIDELKSGKAKEQPEPKPEPKPEPPAAPPEAKKAEEEPSKPAKQTELYPPESPRHDKQKELLDDLDSEYEHARNSKFKNLGEDIKDSARHKRNEWKSLAQSEEDGTAHELVTRDKLLKAEPPEISSHATVDNWHLPLLAHFALRSFPAKPMPDDQVKRYSAEEQKEYRKQYYDALNTMKAKAEEIASRSLAAPQHLRKLPMSQAYDHDGEAEQAVRELRATASNIIKELRSGGSPTRQMYNPIANNLVSYANNVLSPYKRRGNSVIADLHDFNQAHNKKYGKPSRSVDSQETAHQHAMQILEGASVAKAFDQVKTKTDVLAATYVKTASRTGGPKVPETTKKQQDFILNEAKFRGLQWGNSVTDKEREHHLQKTAEAMVDLADVLGIPVGDVSGNGHLALAIGARGKGDALAHYEPRLKVINLTRNSGIGSLAHEWGHFFDHQLTSFVGFLSERVGDTRQPPRGATGPTMSAMNQLVKSKEWKGFKDRIIERLKAAVREKQVSAKKANEYWLADEEMFARTFERYVQRKLETSGRKNTYLIGIESQAYKSGGLWPTDEEVDALTPHFDALFDAYREEKHGTKERVNYSADERQRLIEKLTTELTRYANSAHPMHAAAPTKAQAEAGNYRKAHMILHGLPITIETPKGRKRKADWPPLAAHYGYIKKTVGKDGDHVDVYVGPNRDSKKVWIVDQVKSSGAFDEHKCLVGFSSRQEAIDAYLACYSGNWRLGQVTEMTVDQFRSWLATGDTKAPIKNQATRYSAAEILIERYRTKKYDDKIASGEYRWITIHPSGSDYDHTRLLIRSSDGTIALGPKELKGKKLSDLHKPKEGEAKIDHTKGDRYPVDPKHTPAFEPIKASSKIDKHVLSLVGENAHHDTFHDAKSALLDAHKVMTQESHQWNEALRDLVTNFKSKESIGGMISGMRRYQGDHDKIPHFDEMVEYAQKYQPILLSGGHSEPGQALMEAFHKGYKEAPSIYHDSVAQRAFQMAGHASSGKSSLLDDTDWESVPFSNRAALRQ